MGEARDRRHIGGRVARWRVRNGCRDQDLHLHGLAVGHDRLAAAYEKASGHKVAVAARIGPALPQALNSNEPGDIVANFTQAFDALIKQGKVVPGSVVEVARAGVGVAIRKGAPKPDISTVDAYKQTMLKASRSATRSPAAA